MGSFELNAERDRLGLEPNCAQCFGLCCVAHGFRASASFPFDKLPGKPCPNLLADFGCNIHHTLRQEGFSGCTAYTCYGAGQRVSQGIFRGIDWRQAPETAGTMFQALPMVRQLYQVMWFITEALDRCLPGAEKQQLLELLATTERLAAQDGEMFWGDVDDHCLVADSLLGQVSATIRAAALGGERAPTLSNPDNLTDLSSPDLRGAGLRGANLRGADLRGSDLRGADLRGSDLRGADLRGANLWGAALSDADLSGADLRWADLMGADLSRANLSDAGFSAAIFLTQSQLQLADGNARTILSDPLRTPEHWTESSGQS